MRPSACSTAAPPPLTTARSAATVALRSECGTVLVDVAVRAGGGQPQLPELGLAALEPGLEPDDLAIRLVLRERQVEEVVRLFAGVRADQVCRHVVRRAERRVEVERAAGRERGDLIERHERTPQHDRVAEIVDAATARPSGQLRVLAGREERMVIAGELRQLLDHHRPRRHVDTDRQRLGGEHHLHETLREAGFDDLLERRHHARVVSSDPGLQLREELAVAEDGEVVVLHPGQPALDDLADADALVDARQLHAGSQARLRRFGARVAAEDEVDRRQHVLGVEAFDDLEPRSACTTCA